MFVGTLKLNRALQFVFASLTILFWLLAIADATENGPLKTFAGYEGIVCGLSAKQSAGFTTQPVEQLETCDCCPLSLRERVRVRGSA